MFCASGCVGSGTATLTGVLRLPANIAAVARIRGTSALESAVLASRPCSTALPLTREGGAAGRALGIAWRVCSPSGFRLVVVLRSACVQLIAPLPMASHLLLPETAVAGHMEPVRQTVGPSSELATQHLTGPQHHAGQPQVFRSDGRAQQAVDRRPPQQFLPPDGTQASQLLAWAPAPPPPVFQSHPLAASGEPLPRVHDASCLPSHVGGWSVLPPVAVPLPPPVHWPASHDGGRGQAHQRCLADEGAATALPDGGRRSLPPPPPSRSRPARSTLNDKTPSLLSHVGRGHASSREVPGRLSPSGRRDGARGGHSAHDGRAAYPVGLPAVSHGVVGSSTAPAGRVARPPPGREAPPVTAAAAAPPSGFRTASLPGGWAALSSGCLATPGPPGNPAAGTPNVLGGAPPGGWATLPPGVPGALPPSGWASFPPSGLTTPGALDDPAVPTRSLPTEFSSGIHTASPTGGRAAHPLVNRIAPARPGGPVVRAPGGRAMASRDGRAEAPRGGGMAPLAVGSVTPAALGGLEGHPRGGRMATASGGRMATTRVGLTATARGFRTATARGGRTAAARGGRPAPLRGGRAALPPRVPAAAPLQGSQATPQPQGDVAAPVLPNRRGAPVLSDGLTPLSQHQSRAVVGQLSPPVFMASPTLQLSASPFAPAGSSSVNSLLLEAAKRPKVAMRRRGGAGAKVAAWNSDSSEPSQTRPGGPSGGRIDRPNVRPSTGRRPGSQLPSRRPGGTAASSGVRPSASARLTQPSDDEVPPSSDPGPSKGARGGGTKKRASRRATEREPPAVEASWKMVHKEVKAMRAEHLHSMGRFDTATARLATVGQLVEATSAQCKTIADAVADLRRPMGSGSGNGRTRGEDVDDEADVDVVARWFRPVRVRCASLHILVSWWGCFVTCDGRQLQSYCM